MSDSENVVHLAKKLLHFHPKWFEYEMLPLEFFEGQLQKFQDRDNDPIWASLEHYRYAAFNSFFTLQPHLIGRACQAVCGALRA